MRLVLNRLFEVQGLNSIKVENLDFRDGSFYTIMNRILTRAGMAAVKAKLISMSETLGIEIYEINSAYASQECSDLWVRLQTESQRFTAYL